MTTDSISARSGVDEVLLAAIADITVPPGDLLIGTGKYEAWALESLKRWLERGGISLSERTVIDPLLLQRARWALEGTDPDATPLTSAEHAALIADLKNAAPQAQSGAMAVPSPERHPEPPRANGTSEVGSPGPAVPAVDVRFDKKDNDAVRQKARRILRNTLERVGLEGLLTLPDQDDVRQVLMDALGEQSRSTNEQDGEPLAYLLTGKQGFKSVQRVKPPADSEWEVTPLFARSSTANVDLWTPALGALLSYLDNEGDEPIGIPPKSARQLAADLIRVRDSLSASANVYTFTEKQWEEFVREMDVQREPTEAIKRATERYRRLVESK